jgi:hypothetical protein
MMLLDLGGHCATLSYLRLWMRDERQDVPVSAAYTRGSFLGVS